MPNVLPTSSNAPGEENNSKNHKLSGWAVFMTIVLSVVVILIGERLIFDLNKYANPQADYVKDNSISAYSYESMGYSRDKSGLAGESVYYLSTNADQYKLYKVMIHAAFILPAFVLIFVLYSFGLSRKPEWKVAIWAYIVGAVWLLMHLLIEIANYIIIAYKSAAIYIILIFMAIIFTSLSVLLQKRKNQ